MGNPENFVMGGGGPDNISFSSFFEVIKVHVFHRGSYDLPQEAILHLEEVRTSKSKKKL